MLGIVLLALAAVIGLGFGVFAIAKGVANEGTVNVQDSLGTVSTQVFLDFDQKVITGTQASAAIKTFEGKPYSVLISTKALAGGQKIASVADRPTGSGAYIFDDNQGNRYINYNAVLATASNGTLPSQINGGSTLSSASSTPSSAILQMKNGTLISSFGFALKSTDGTIVFDNAIGGLSKSGNAEFIPNNTKFQANLVKDASGAIMGIALKQI